MIKAAKAKKVEKKQAADVEAAINSYQAPLLVQEPVIKAPVQVVTQPQNSYTYALIEPEQPKQVVAVTPPTITPVQQPVQ